jgi:hypothetical protein
MSNLEKREEELRKEGWVKQFTASEPRLSEAVELYESLGFEVHLEPVRPEELSEECKACFEFAPEECKTIYTRRIRQRRELEIEEESNESSGFLRTLQEACGGGGAYT